LGIAALSLFVHFQSQFVPPANTANFPFHPSAGGTGAISPSPQENYPMKTKANRNRPHAVCARFTEDEFAVPAGRG
jgi:hypothetical protein